MHAPRKKVGPVAGLVLSFGFGLLLLVVSTADLFVVRTLPVDQPLPVTVRIPGIGLYRDTITGGAVFQHQRKIHPRGHVLSTEQQRVVRAFEDLRRPPRPALLLGLGLTFVVVFLVFISYARSRSKRPAYPRTQVALLLLLVSLAIGSKALLLFTAWTGLWIPLTLAVVPVGLQLGRRAASATAVAGAVILSLLTPIDLWLLVVLLAQGLTAALIAGGRGQLRAGQAALGAMVSSGVAFLALSLVLGESPLPTAMPWYQSGLLASAGGALVGGLLGWLLSPAVGKLMGFVSRGKLLAMSNQDTPVLKQLASRAPGTWAHSMAVANMAETAASAIGADGLLVRVGAYYHDIGKAAQPQYFIENQEGANPHDELAPDVSADAIFSHVSEGLKMARKHNIPDHVAEFIATHHGGALLEFFWHKNRENGNPKQLEERDFRYPGYPPQSRETAILALCDAVEAASRTLEDPNREEIQDLVRRLTLGKLEQGLLSDSELTLEDLQRVMVSLVETLRSARHARIRYPWQGPAKEPPESKKVQDSQQPEPAPEQDAKTTTERDDGTPAKAAAPAPVPPPETAAQPDPPWTEAEGTVDDDALEPGRERIRTMPLGMAKPGDPDTPSKGP
jgi:putative nucleotidyltransferase with HDIG domain